MDNTLMVSVEILIDNIIDFSKSDIRNLLREQIELELGRQFDDDFLIHEESIKEENINTGEIIKSIKFTSIISKNI